MTSQITIRPTTSRDLPQVDALLRESYPKLLKADYPPSVLVTALPLIARANPALLRSGSYYMAEDGDDRVLAAGGWSHSGPQGGVGPRDLGHVRHVVTHPSATRRGLAGAILERCFSEARAAGITWMMAQSTRTAVPFYRAMGFEERAEIEVMLRPGIGFPAVEMARGL
ncbi:GNAT family N-acetyltransferase [Roseibacterium sp. SDUM158016]|jgi:GNAT superfamily N-acetyltransferase|uniref:GNAT family N-acetyltransferase n=1 Tax=Roseicyclus sediminis TaxID=2980997 RepID=UPI0021D3BF2E|nr:GNAT family N-acetyltransferase [Roseibacterium sp. SDUM158016]MCU4652595.1 GNAT family N-acetyltransferase [Roseibacterium sp. SDUM158016]